jgi:hypothetical protein
MNIEKEIVILRSQVHMLEKKIRMNILKCEKTLHSIERLYPYEEKYDIVMRKSSSRKLNSISSDFSILFH